MRSNENRTFQLLALQPLGAGRMVSHQVRVVCFMGCHERGGSQLAYKQAPTSSAERLKEFNKTDIKIKISDN